MPAGLFFIPTAELERLERGEAEVVGALGGYLPAELVGFLPAMVRAVRELAPPAEPICGVEVFLSRHSSEEVCAHAGLHIDTNEPDWDSARVSWGSILHVGPTEILSGGGTTFYPRLPVPEAILARCFAPNTFDSLDALTAEWHHVERRENRLLAFDGRLPHYADRCQARPDAPRIALIVTGWTTLPRFARPGAFSPMTAAEYQAFTTAPEEHLAVVRNHHDLGKVIGPAQRTLLDRAMATLLGM